VTEEGVRTKDPRKPRLVVFGSVDFVDNESLFLFGQRNFALFAGALDWLGERPVVGVFRGFAPPEPRPFELRIPAP